MRYIIFLIILLMPCTNLYANKSELNITLSVNKTELSIGELLEITFTLNNNSPTDIALSFLDNSAISTIDFFSVNGYLIHWKSDTIPSERWEPNRSDLFFLGTGQKKTFIYKFKVGFGSVHIRGRDYSGYYLYNQPMDAYIINKEPIYFIQGFWEHNQDEIEYFVDDLGQKIFFIGKAQTKKIKIKILK